MDLIFSFEDEGTQCKISRTQWDDKEELGRGGSGAVYEVKASCETQGSTKTKVFAVKLSLSEESNDRINHEIKILKGIGAHRNLPKVLASKAIQGKTAIVLEKYDLDVHKALTEHDVSKNGPFPSAELLAASLFRGLSRVSRRGYCNRDVKLENVLLKRGGKEGKQAQRDLAASATLTDFDTSIKVEEKQIRGQVVGSPGSMSPEQALSSIRITSKSDVFAASANVARLILPSRLFKLEQGEDDTYVKRILNSYVTVLGQWDEEDLSELEEITLLKKNIPDAQMTDQTCLTARLKEAKVSEEKLHFYKNFFQRALSYKPSSRPSPFQAFKEFFNELTEEEKGAMAKLDDEEKQEAVQECGGEAEAKKFFQTIY